MSFLLCFFLVVVLCARGQAGRRYQARGYQRDAKGGGVVHTVTMDRRGLPETRILMFAMLSPTEPGRTGP